MSTLTYAPRRVALEINWGQVFGGFLVGAVVTVLMVYGVIPAMAEVGAAKIRKRKK